MAENANCLCEVRQTGWDACAEENPLIVAVILMKLRDSDNEKNFLDLTQPLDVALADSLINEPDLEKRMYYIDDLEEVSYLPKDKRTITTKADTDLFIDKDKPFVFGATRYDMPMTVIGSLDASFCQGYGAIYVLADGCLVVSSEEDDKAYPKAIQDGTISFVTGNDKGGATKNNGIISWTERKTETLKKYKVIVPAAGFVDSLVKVRELKSTVSDNSVIGTLKLNVDLYHGKLNSPIHYVKSKPAQFSIVNDAGSSVVTVNDAVIGTDCDTTLTYDTTGLNTGDVITVTLSANGYYLPPFKVTLP